MTVTTGTGAGAALRRGRGPCPPVGTPPGRRSGGACGAAGRAAAGAVEPGAGLHAAAPGHAPGSSRPSAGGAAGAAEGGPGAVEGAACAARRNGVRERLWAESPTPPSPPSCKNILTQVIKAISICIPVLRISPCHSRLGERGLEQPWINPGAVTKLARKKKPGKG